MMRRREGARGRRERLRAEAQIRLQLCRDAVHSARRRQGPGERHEMHYTAKFRRRLSPKGASQHLCLRLLAGSHGFRGTPWTRSSTPFLGYRRSMVLCRLWWYSWWKCSNSLTRSYLLPCRLLMCPSSSSSVSRREPRFASRSWRISWWKYLGSFPTLRYSEIVDQNVDIPVPHGRDGGEGLLGLHPGPSSTGFLAERIIVQ